MPFNVISAGKHLINRRNNVLLHIYLFKMIDLFITWDVSPFIFKIGSFELRWYSLLFAMVFVAGYLILQKMFKKEGVKNDYLDKLFIYVFLGVLIGARLGHCLFYEPQYYLTRPWEMIIPFDFSSGRFTGYQGLSSHGGAIGILTMIYLYCRKTKLYYMWVLDRLVIVVALAGLFIRTGNLMNSEIYGNATSLPWGFVFARNGEEVAKHPTQIYEALTYFSIFLILLVYYLKKDRKPKSGMIFGWFLILVFGARFFLEFLKENQEAFEENMMFNMGQLLSLPFVILGIFILYWSNRGKFKNVIFTNTKNKSAK